MQVLNHETPSYFGFVTLAYTNTTIAISKGNYSNSITVKPAAVKAAMRYMFSLGPNNSIPFMLDSLSVGLCSKDHLFLYQSTVT